MNGPVTQKTEKQSQWIAERSRFHSPMNPGHSGYRDAFSRIPFLHFCVPLKLVHYDWRQWKMYARAQISPLFPCWSMQTRFNAITDDERGYLIRHWHDVTSIGHDPLWHNYVNIFWKGHWNLGKTRHYDPTLTGNCRMTINSSNKNRAYQVSNWRSTR